jgi:hypothetical protein
MGVLFQSLVKPHVQKQLKTAVKHQTAKINKATRGGAVGLNVANITHAVMQNPDPSTGLKQGSKANQVYKNVFWNIGEKK